MMPGGTGPELLSRVLSSGRVVPALFISGYDRAALVQQGTLDPASPFLQKPFTAPRFLALVRQVLDKSGARHGAMVSAA
jgi:FixJ family two-component response regulator